MMCVRTFNICKLESIQNFPRQFLHLLSRGNFGGLAKKQISATRQLALFRESHCSRWFTEAVYCNSKGQLISYDHNQRSNSKNKTTSSHHLIPAFLALSFFASKRDESSDRDKLISMIKHAVLAIQGSELRKAEQLLHVALKSAQELQDQNAITYIYDMMANLALQEKAFEKAEKLFVEVLKRFLDRGVSTDDNAVVEVSLKLASIYANLGQTEKAAEGFEFCIRTQEEKLKRVGEETVDDDTMVLWAMSQDWSARFLLSVGQYDRAKERFLRAYDVCVKVMGAEDPQTAVLLNDLGSVCSLLKNYEEATEYLLKAIDVGKKSNSEDLGSFYINLGTVYLQKGLSEEAKGFCSEGLKVATRHNNEDAIGEGKACLENIRGLRTD